METFDDLRTIHREVTCAPFEYRVGIFTEDLFWVEASLVRKDAYRGDTLTRGYGGKLLIPAHVSEDTAVKTFFVAGRNYAEHEVRESFEWRGKRVLGPHIPLTSMLEIAV